VDTVVRDNAGKLGDGISAYEYYRQQTPKPGILLMTPTYVAEALKDRSFEDDIVQFFDGGSNSALFPIKYNVGMSSHYAGSVAGALEWARKHWKGGVMKIGIMTWDTVMGRALMDDQFRKWIASQEKMELVGEDVYKPTDVDVTTGVIRLKNKGANWIIDNSLGNGPVVTSKAINSLGLLSQDINDTSPGKIHRIVGPWGVSDDVVRLGGGSGGLMEGAIGVRYVASYQEKDNLGVKLVLDSARRNNRGPNILNMVYIHKFAKLDIVCHVVGKVVDKYGWEGVNGKNIWKEITSLKNYNANNLAEITFRPDYPVINRAKVYMVQKGELIPVSSYIDLPDMTPGLRK